ncbi:MAG: hypothetical protein WC859_09790 [Elusimicrobiota bacterium]
MKILIIDDDQEKRRLLTRTALSVVGIKQEHITYASDVWTAKRSLREHLYDLVVLDINLPRRPDLGLETGAGVDVLHFIKNNASAKSPRFLFGLTAFDDGFAAAEAEFSSPLWKLVRFSHTDLSWESTLREAFAYLAKSSKPPYRTDGRTFHTDLAIVAALEDEELDAVLALQGGWQVEHVEHDNTRYYRGTFSCPRGDISVVASAAPRMGMSPAAVLTSKMIHNFRPRMVAMAGICAGVRSKVKIGDILIADPCFDWGSGKWIKDQSSGSIKFLPAAYQWRLDERLRVKAKALGGTPSLLARIYEAYGLQKPSNIPEVHVEAMASGASVLQASSLMADVGGQHRNLVGIEMESYAVFTACQQSAEPRPECISIKSVCDFGDEDKTDSAHRYAAYVSATFLFEFALDALINEPMHEED